MKKSYSESEQCIYNKWRQRLTFLFCLTAAIEHRLSRHSSRTGAPVPDSMLMGDYRRGEMQLNEELVLSELIVFIMDL